MKSAMLSPEHPVILEKPAIFSRLFLWMIMLVTTSGIVWAYFASVEQAVPATGQLALKDGAREIQAPTTGTVVRLHVENGDRVVKGQPLLTFNPTNPSADFDSLTNLRNALERENQFYGNIVQGETVAAPTDLEAVVKDREARLAENQAFRALINELYYGQGGGVNLTAAQQNLYSNYRAEYQSRVSAAQLQIQELRQQFQQEQRAEQAARDQRRSAEQQLQFAQQQLQFSEQQLENTRAQLSYSREQLSLAEQQLVKSEQVLQSNQAILERLRILEEEGGIAQLQRERQEQEVAQNESAVLGQQDQIKARQGEINTREGEINARQGEINGRLSEITSREAEIRAAQAEIDRRIGEQRRIQVAIQRAEEQLQNTKDGWARDLFTRIADNEKAIASIESQMGRSKLENEKRLSEVRSQLEKVQESQQSQVLKAPVSGVIFDLKPGTKENATLAIQEDNICQYVINTVLRPGEPRPNRCEEAFYEAQQTERLLTILDDDEGLEAVVYLQNKDVALVLNALQEKRKILEPYHGEQLAGGEIVDCEPGKTCVCPELPENREKLGITDRQCVPVEVNVEAFPAMEFGTVPGEVKYISKDAVPPTETRPFYAFETKVKLDRQTFVLDSNQGVEIGLQSGMAVGANINIGKRTVLEMFISRFTGKLDSLKTVK